MDSVVGALSWIRRRWVLVVLGLLVLILVVVWGGGSGEPEPLPTSRPAATAELSSPGAGQSSAPLPADDFPTVAYDDLPDQAKRTLDLIARDGPFPFAQDGRTFQNRERRLPPGSYVEFTVPTPGESDRGARRIVQQSRDGTVYYTDDHYETFRRVQR